MNRRGLRLLGHPVHPMVAGFPIALWVFGSAGDLLSRLAPEGPWSEVAFWALLTGTVLALPAAASGFVDLISLAPGHPGERIGWWHLSVMSAALGLEAASLALRRQGLGMEPASTLALGLALAGGILCLGGGWLGGELVFRHGVGVTGPEVGDGGAGTGDGEAAD